MEQIDHTSSNQESSDSTILSIRETTRSFRSWPLLVLAFGCVILLMIGADVAMMERAKRLNASVSEVNERYHNSARSLERLRSGIHLSSLLLRDYLLDPRAERVFKYRSEMLALRSQTEEHLNNLLKSMPSRETQKLKEMGVQLNAYWETLDPVFEWTPQEKQAYSFAFLRHRVIPKRASVMAIAADVEAFNNAALQEQRNKIAEQEADFNAFLRRVALLSLVAGLIVAFVSIFRVSQLESRGERQHVRTMEAETQMRQLSQQLVHAQEEERRSISRELHDEIGQMLTGLRMEFRSLAKMHNVPSEQFQSRIEQGKALLDQALQAVRDIAMGLRPSMLDDLGLEAALQWQVRDFCRRHEIPVNITVRTSLGDLPERDKTNLYRIVQEALTNCARHSKAKSISIVVDRENGALRLVVRDDGVGFRPGKHGKGLGLVGIQERAREMGGWMSIESNSRGTSLTVVMPMDRSAAFV
jgi:signal transduction histidine kinase